MQKTRNKDYSLWEDFRNGDDSALYKLYDLYADALLGFGMHFSRDTGLLKDCIHDLFLDLFKYRNSLSYTDNVKFYLFKSLKRKIQKELSKRSLFDSDNDAKILQGEAVPSYDDVIIEAEIEQENFNVLRQAVDKLPCQQQEALFLKFQQDLSYQQIAQIQNISIESARTNIYRAIKALRKSFENGPSLLQVFLILPYSDFSK